jgi:Zn-dependent M28 family amino/carboxypeptidase
MSAARRAARAATLGLAAFAAVVAAAAEPPPAIDPDQLARHLRILASDAFEGRAPATPGEARTVDYLVEQFRLAGLQPGGADGSWTQDVPLLRSQVVGEVAAAVQVGDTTLRWTQGEDVALQSLYPVEQVVVEAAPLVFIGYGVHAPERGWDDYKGVDLRGKVAVVLINDPDFEGGEGDFDGNALTYYGRWSYKYEEAVRRGARLPRATARNGGLGPLFDIAARGDAASQLQLRGWLHRDAAQALFSAAGLDLAAEKRRAQRRDFSPRALGDARLDARLRLEREQVVTRNVLARLPGSERPQETVIFAGHWDGFGVGHADAGGDRIYNSAVDNATALAAMLEMARVFAAGPALPRSLLFFAPTTEERGLLGAHHYAANPPWPLATTVAMLNIEMLSPFGANRDISSWGRGRVSLEQDLARVAKRLGRSYSPDPDLAAGYFYRADHFALARVGVPAITIGPGLDRVDGGIEAGRALRAKLLAERYHQPADEFSEDWDMAGQAADVSLIFALGRELASGTAWPRWEPGSEFAAIRAASAAARGE